MDKTIIPTRNSHLTSAALCRANGWKIGTWLTCPASGEGSGRERGHTIEITGIGQAGIFAICVEHPECGREGQWGLTWRDWTEDEHGAFRAHLKRQAAVVATWPAWKQEALRAAFT